MPPPVHPRVQLLRRKKLRKYISCGLFLAMAFLGWQYWHHAIATAATKPYTLTIDGAEFPLRCTEITVGECLHADNIIVYEKDYLWPAMTTHLEADMHVIVRRAIPVTYINLLGEEQVIFSHGTTVKDVLADAQFVLTDDNRVVPAANTLLEPHMRIQVLAEHEETYVRKRDIAYASKEKKDATLLIGKRVVDQKGILGLKEETYQLIYIGDTLKEKKLLKTEVVTQPQDEIVRVGTQMPTHTQTIAEGKASFYSANLDGSLTATGVAINLHELVAAHKTLPFGSLVRVTNVANGKSVVVRIVDRGPYVAGRVIDLSPAAFQQIASLSSGVVNVRLDLIVD